MKRNYTISEFCIYRDKFKICGKEYRPVKAGKALTPVIISHGFMGNQREGMPEAIALAENGYIAFTFDFVGGTTFGKSGGTSLDMNIFTEKEDLRAVMDYVKSLSCVDYSKLVLAGCSQGGFVSGLVAADYPEEVKRLILLYPALCIPDDARNGTMAGFRFDPKNVPDVLVAGKRKINGDYARLVMDMDAVDAISSFPGRVLIICGKKDPVVKYSYMEQLLLSFRRKRNAENRPDASIQFFPVQDAMHGFRGNEISMVSKRIVAFMKGYDEALTIAVDITNIKLENHFIRNTSYVSFDAVCANTYFTGKSLPGAMDVQKRKLWMVEEFKADYVMHGTDYEGEACDIHIINLDRGDGWKPTVSTNSKALDFLNKKPCITIAEGYKEGLYIHILGQV